ncbi:MAG: DUF5674 family protein [Patescibacteria group bacterium]
MKNNIKIVTEKSSFNSVVEGLYAYPDYIKGVVDIENSRLALGGEWHADAEKLLAETGSLSSNNWGFNIYFNDNSIVYNSMVNIKPALGYKTMTIDNPELISKIDNVINEYLIFDNNDDTRNE